MTGLSKKEISILCALTLLGALLRCYNLDHWPIFGDEINTIVESKAFKLGAETEEREHWTVVTNSLSHILTGLSYTLFGETVRAARLVPLFFGILSLPVFFFLIRKLFGKKVAFLAILLMTFSPNLLFLSGFARYNSMLFFLGGTAFLTLLIGFIQKNRAYLMVGGGCAPLAILAHGTAIFVPVLFLVFAGGSVLFSSESRKRNLKILLFFAGPFLIAALIFREELSWVSMVIQRNFMGSGAGYSPLRLAGSVAYNNGPVLTLFALLAAYQALVQRKKENLGILLYWSVPFALTVLGSAWFQTGPRYLTSVLPGFYLLCALGLAHCISLFEDRRKWAGPFLVVFVLASQGPLLCSSLVDGGRYDTTSACRFVEKYEQSSPGHVVFAEGHMVYDYLARMPIDIRELPGRLEQMLRSLEEIDKALLVFPLQRGIPFGLVGANYFKWINTHCRLLRSFTRKRFDFMRFEVAVYEYLKPSE